MCACKETVVRESANDCILASGEGHGICGETFHPIYAASPVSSAAERSVFNVWRTLLFLIVWFDVYLLLALGHSGQLLLHITDVQYIGA
jgi:hypothetical protein